MTALGPYHPARPTNLKLAGWLSALSRRLRWAFILHGPILVALFYLLWVAGALEHGRWTNLGSSQDPTEYFLTAIVYVAICTWFWLGIAAFLLPILQAGSATHPTRHLLDFTATLALLLLSLAYLLTDPHRLLSWFAD